MAKSLAEYAAQNPMPEPPQEQQARATAKGIAERREEIEQAERLKESIAQQIEKGGEPQAILYTALRCIGLLTNDAEWTEATQTALDRIYADLAQLSFTIDTAQKERERLQQMQAEYNSKLRATIRQRIRQYEKVGKALYAVLDAVEEIEPETPGEE